MNTEKFLKEFAEKFGRTEEEKKDILKTNKITIDYADGVFDLLHEDYETDTLSFLYHGGSNGSIFKDEDYRFVWDNLIYKDPKFACWLDGHRFTETDMMVICVDICNKDRIDVHCSFSFYGSI